MSDFLAMGGYGPYVWVAYGVTALALALLFVWSWLGARSRDAELQQVREMSRSERRNAATATLRPETSGMAGQRNELDPAESGDRKPTIETGISPVSTGNSSGGTA